MGKLFFAASYTKVFLFFCTTLIQITVSLTIITDVGVYPKQHRNIYPIFEGVIAENPG